MKISEIIRRNFPLDTEKAALKTLPQFFCRKSEKFCTQSPKMVEFEFLKWNFFFKMFLCTCRIQFWQPCQMKCCPSGSKSFAQFSRKKHQWIYRPKISFLLLWTRRIVLRTLQKISCQTSKILFPKIREKINKMFIKKTLKLILWTRKNLFWQHSPFFFSQTLESISPKIRKVLKFYVFLAYFFFSECSYG